MGKGHNVLLAASENGCLKIVNMLIASGAKLNLTNAVRACVVIIAIAQTYSPNRHHQRNKYTNSYA